MSLPNIEYKGDISKFITAEDDPYSMIMYYKDREWFEDPVAYSKFIKACETMVRTSKEYSAFLSWIKNVLGINFCQISSKITADDATIEMHHNILTLYDICAVLVNHYIRLGKKVTTMRIANRCIDEHFALRVQVIMACVTYHEGVHNRDIFVNFNQGIGNLAGFIEEYAADFDDDLKYKIWTYLNASKANESYDKGLLDLEHVQKYIKL